MKIYSILQRPWRFLIRNHSCGLAGPARYDWHMG